MYLVINQKVGAVFQQKNSPTEEQLKNEDLLFFSAEMMRIYPDKEKEIVFEISSRDSMSGWEEVSILDEYLKHFEDKNFQKAIDGIKEMFSISKEN